MYVFASVIIDYTLCLNRFCINFACSSDRLSNNYQPESGSSLACLCSTQQSIYETLWHCVNQLSNCELDTHMVACLAILTSELVFVHLKPNIELWAFTLLHHGRENWRTWSLQKSQQKSNYRLHRFGVTPQKSGTINYNPQKFRGHFISVDTFIAIVIPWPQLTNSFIPYSYIISLFQL